MKKVNLLLAQELPNVCPLFINALGFMGDFGSLNKGGWDFCISPSHNGRRTRFYMKHSLHNIACGSIKLDVPWSRHSWIDPDTFEYDRELRMDEESFIDILSYLGAKHTGIDFNYMCSIKQMVKLEKLEMMSADEQIDIPKSFTTEQLLDMIIENEKENTELAKASAKRRMYKPSSAQVIDFEKFKNTDARIAEILAA